MMKAYFKENLIICNMCWTHRSHLRWGGGGGGVNECGTLFQKLPLHKHPYLAITIYSLLIHFIYNQLNVNIHQQNISLISHHHKEHKEHKMYVKFYFYYELQSLGYHQQLNRVQLCKSTSSIMKDSTYTTQHKLRR
jgi:hypothetical protein